jgi:hypothetical protein
MNLSSMKLYNAYNYFYIAKYFLRFSVLGPTILLQQIDFLPQPLINFNFMIYQNCFIIINFCHHPIKEARPFPL